MKSGVFVVRDAWLEEEQHPVDEVMASPFGGSPGSERSSPGHYGSMGSRFQTEGGKLVGRCVLHPSSAQRFSWDVLSVMLILYDTVTLPMMLAFQDGDTDWSRGVFWFALFFWTTDMPLSFITGYFTDGTEEVELPLIIKRYLRTWFLFDILLVGSDWFGVIVGDRHKGFALVRVGKTLRILRTLRSLRLLRLMKLRRIMHNVQDRVHSDNSNVILDVLKGTILILSLSHFLACSWYGLSYSSLPADEGSAPGWVEAQGLDHEDLNMRYFVSLSWSLSQVAPAGTDISANSVGERIFAAVVALLGLVAFTFYIGSITSAMTALKHSSFDENFSLLRRFLRGRGIPTEVSMRVIRYVEHEVQLQKRQIQEKDVHLLRLLSEPLRMELAKHTYQPVLVRHPFFRYYAHSDPEAIKSLCATALTTSRYSAGDIVFTEGRSQDCMMFLLRGRLRYVPKKQRSFAVPNKVQQNSLVPRFAALQRWNTTQLLEDLNMEEGDWCSEASLWTRWAHVGTMRALVDSEILLVDSSIFAEVTSSHRKVTRAAASYGQGLVERLNYGVGEGLLSDLPRVDSVEWEELASAAFAGGGYRSGNPTDLSKVGLGAIRRTGTILGLGMDPLKWIR